MVLFHCGHESPMCCKSQGCVDQPVKFWQVERGSTCGETECPCSELCRLSVPIWPLWLSCRTAVLSLRLFHSQSKRSATHVLSAPRDEAWSPSQPSDQQDVTWHVPPGVTYNGTVSLLAPLTLNGWLVHKTQQDLDSQGVIVKLRSTDKGTKSCVCATQQICTNNMKLKNSSVQQANKKNKRFEKVFLYICHTEMFQIIKLF